jgi:hypothetical protein
MRIVAITININPNIPDIKIKAAGNLKFPARSEADVKTDSM